MENVFIKEVVCGKMVVIRNLNVSDLIRIGLMNIDDDVLKVAHMMSCVTTIDGERLSPEDILKSENIQLYSFISEAVGRMTCNLNF